MKHLTILCVLSLLIILAACGQLEGDGLLFATADPNLSVGFRLLPAPPGVTVEPTATAEPTTVALATIEAPQVACEIKANVSGSDKIYHLPGGVYYDRVKVDMSQGDFWACTEAEAEAAGFRKSSR